MQWLYGLKTHEVEKFERKAERTVVSITLPLMTISALRRRLGSYRLFAYILLLIRAEMLCQAITLRDNVLQGKKMGIV